jgi:hypothetical protein
LILATKESFYIVNREQKFNSKFIYIVDEMLSLTSVKNKIMKKNVGKMDRIVRFAIAIILIILAYAKIIPANLSLATYVVAILIASTGIFRFCLLYKPFGISTCREKSPF